MQAEKEFWLLADRMTEDAEIVIDRPKGSRHPQFPDYIYPLDYGYLKGTSAADGSGIDVWVGSLPHKKPTAILSSLDLLRKDAEIKILIACSDTEIELIETFHNKHASMQALLNKRPDTC